MEDDYNWNLILKVSVPFALIESYIFYANLSNFWKWSSLAIALFLTALLIYINDRRKSNIFTAVGIVFLIALVVRFLRNSGIL